MNFKEILTVQSYHRNRLGGSTSHAQGWLNDESQISRFEVLAKFEEFSGKSVLDLGCGLGDFKSFLDHRFIDFEYLGVDMLKEFIVEARELFADSPRTSFVQADFTTGSLPESDIVIASGSLNYQVESELHPWEVIRNMWNCSRIGVAFNLLDSRMFKAGALLCGYNPQEVHNFCLTLTPNVEIITGYQPNDFTVYMRRL